MALTAYNFSFYQILLNAVLPTMLSPYFSLFSYFLFSAFFCFFYLVPFLFLLEAVVQRCSVKKLLLEISQNLQENTCVRVSFLIKFVGLRPSTLLKKRLLHMCFTVNFVKFLRTPFFIDHLRWLLLSLFIITSKLIKGKFVQPFPCLLETNF